MCTVTFIAQQRGYCLGMNRDEKLTRPTGLPPKQRKFNGRIVLSPSEPGGGTWIALNDRRVTFALINWYAIKERAGGKPVSRGKVVNTVSTAILPDLADEALAMLPLNRINPFRLIGIFPQTRQVVEWRWNLDQLNRIFHPWETRQWISSGFDEPGAQRVRSRTFRQALTQRTAGGAEWLRRLHRSHSPQSGPFSTCMHRKDAVTVSYTEIRVSPGEASMCLHAGPPCETNLDPEQRRGSIFSLRL